MCLLGISSWFHLSEKFLLADGLPFYYISYQMFQINVRWRVHENYKDGSDTSQDSIVDPFSFPFSLHFSLEHKMSFHGYNYCRKSISPVHISVLKFKSVCPTNQSSSEVWQETRFMMFPNQNSLSDNPRLLLLTFTASCIPSLPTNQFPSLDCRS